MSRPFSTFFSCRARVWRLLCWPSISLKSPAFPTGSYSVRKTEQLPPQGSGALTETDQVSRPNNLSSTSAGADTAPIWSYQVRQDSTASVPEKPSGDTSRHAHARTIRDHAVIVCAKCLVAHPKQIPKTLSGTLGETPVSHVPAGRRRADSWCREARQSEVIALRSAAGQKKNRINFPQNYKFELRLSRI
eukprot:864081-Amphidinium_carterae.1